MATINLYSNLGELGSLTDFIDGDHLTLNPFSEQPSQMYVLDFLSAQHDGAGVILYANPASDPFTYSNFTPTGGHIIEATFIDSNVNSLIDVTGLDLNVLTLQSAVNLHDVYSILGFVNGGNDRVNGSNIGDDLTIAPGGAGNDTVFGLGGNDSIIGGAGKDLLIGGAGADHMDGDMGTDTASYATSSTTVGVQVTLSGGAGSGADAAGDVLINIENLIGSAAADKLTGDTHNNALAGGKGADVLVGGGGRDSLDGGIGNDKLTGGKGVDTFIFKATFGHDTITDFTDANGVQDDRIQLTHAEYNTLIDPAHFATNVTETTVGGVTTVHLHIGRNVIDVTNWHLADINYVTDPTHSDFILIG